MGVEARQLAGEASIRRTVTAKTTTQRLDARQRAVLCAQIAADNRTRDVIVLETKGIVDWVDYLVLATGTSRRQLVAAADEIDKQLGKLGDKRIGVEGYTVGNWVVLDYADIIIHLFDEEKRQFYQLEHLWADAKRIPWERPGGGETAGHRPAPASR